MLLGVDVGGTFTDAVLLDGGAVHTAKVPTTPREESAGVMRAVEAVLRRAGAAAGDVEVFAHGMTVGTNALLEERGARTALVATAGFADLLEIGRQDRPELYRLCAPKPLPLVEPELRFEAAERIGPDGVVEPLGEDEPERLAAAIEASGAEAVADLPALLLPRPRPRAARSPQHLRERLPGVHVSASHEVLPRFREYERCSTTVIDAYLSPLLGRYLGRLGEAASEAGLPQPLVMRSSGGVAPAEEAARAGAWSVLSGPAGGAVGAGLLAQRQRRRRRPRLRHGRDLLRRLRGRGRRGAPHRLARDRRPPDPAADGRRPHRRRRRRLDRLARQRRGAARRAAVGGRRPGPACYGRGGSEPTVTDANLLLGRLAGDSQLAGGVDLDAGAAERAVAELGRSLGLEPWRPPIGILRVANQEMVRALRVVTVERGVDPRRFALLPFGGAGPMHAAAIAAELGIETILCPRAGGVLSALGLCASERRRDTARTVMLERRGAERRADRSRGRRRWSRRPAPGWRRGARPGHLQAALRRAGLRAAGAGPGRPRSGRAGRGFERAHEERYGHRDPEGEVVLVDIDLALVVPGPAPQPVAAAEGAVERRLPARPLRRRVGRDPGPARRARRRHRGRGPGRLRAAGGDLRRPPALDHPRSTSTAPSSRGSFVRI